MANEALYEWLRNGDMAALNPDLLREAAASVRLDKGERGGTYVVEGAEAKREAQPAGQGQRAITVDEFQAEQPVSEAAVQRAVIDALLLDGYMVLRLNGGGLHVDDRYVEFCRYYYRGQTEAKGLPDLIAMRDGRVILVEMKRPQGGEQSKAQVRFMDAVEDSGCTYVLARSVDDIAPWLDRVAPQ